MLSEKTRTAILQLQKLYPVKRSAIIPALHLAQQEVGYLPLETQKEVADLFDVDANEVNSLVTFYDMFFDKPVGKHVLHVCKNVSCMLRGADDVLQSLCKKLNTTPGEMTEDGQFTVIASECLAACDRAPVILADDRVCGPMQVQDLDQMLAETKKSHGHPCPVPTIVQPTGACPMPTMIQPAGAKHA